MGKVIKFPQAPVRLAATLRSIRVPRKPDHVRITGSMAYIVLGVAIALVISVVGAILLAG